MQVFISLSPSDRLGGDARGEDQWKTSTFPQFIVLVSDIIISRWPKAQSFPL